MTNTQPIDWQGAALSAAGEACRYFTRESVYALIAQAYDGKRTWKDVRLLLVDNTNAKAREAGHI